MRPRISPSRESNPIAFSVIQGVRCASWNRSGRKIADRLGQPLSPVSPPARLRERVPDAVKPQPGIVLTQAGLLIARSADLSWRETPIAGLHLVMASQEDEILG